MKQKTPTKFLSFVLCAALITASLSFLLSCSSGSESDDPTETTDTLETPSDTDTDTDDGNEEAPVDDVARIIFDDNIVSASINSWSVQTPTVVDSSFQKEGSASMKIHFNPESGKSTSAIDFSPQLSITPELKESGVLQFWYYCETDLPQVSVTFFNMRADGTQAENKVNIKDYLTTTDGWSLVQIPLSDFPERGQFWNGSAYEDTDFDFTKIDQMQIYAMTRGITEVTPTYIDSMAILVGVTVSKSEVREPRSIYVSPTGSDGNNGLSPEKPFKTPQRAANATLPGDTVYFMGGTYETRSGSLLNINRSGEEDAYITYTNYEDEKPIFKAGDNVWDTLVVTSSYIVIDGLTLVGINDELTVEEGRASYDAVIKQQDTGVAFDSAAVARTNTNAISINGRSATAAGTEVPHHIIVRNCEVSMFPAAGIATLDADYITIENNIIHDNMWYSLYGSSGISLNGHVDIDDNTTEYKNIVRNNIIYNNKSYVMCQNGRKWSDSNGIIIDYFKNDNNPKKSPYKGKTLVYNNICYQNGGAGIISFNSENVDIFYNTCIDNGQTPELIDWGNIKVGWSNNVRVMHNIALSTRENTYALQFDNKNNNITYKNNLFYNTALPNEADIKKSTNIPDNQLKDNIWADPCIADILNMDFHLTKDSPAIDKGEALDFIPDDFEGNARPQGKNYDLGAYESK